MRSSDQKLHNQNSSLPAIFKLLLKIDKKTIKRTIHSLWERYCVVNETFVNAHCDFWLDYKSKSSKNI